MMLFRTPEVFLHVLLISSIFFSFGGSSANPLDVVNQAKGKIINHARNNHRRPNHIGALIGVVPRMRRPPLARQFLAAHNAIRAKYGVPPLKWDKKLARFARRHGSKLIANCTMVHSEGQYGESLFWGKLDHWTPTRMVENWANEAEFFDFKAGKCTKDWTECGHFTQIVWANTLHVGCYHQKCTGEGKGYIGVCNYDPPGNFVDQSPFNGKNTVPSGANGTPS